MSIENYYENKDCNQEFKLRGNTMIDINDLTLGQVKELTAMYQSESTPGLNGMVGKKCIIRTYSAGAWFGVLKEKSGNEVILSQARRMWRWHAAKSISLSACAVEGLKQSKSKICAPVDNVWLEAIEIIPCKITAVNSIEGCPHVEAE